MDNAGTNMFNIALCTNAGFSVHLSVAIESLLRNTNLECHFFIIYSSMDSNAQADIEKTVALERYSCTGKLLKHQVTFVNYNPEKDLTDENGTLLVPSFRNSLDNYSRIFFPRLLKEYGISRVLYIDGDIVANSNIDEIFTTLNTIKTLGGATELTFNNSDKFFINSGVLLMNLEGLERINFIERCLSYMKKMYPKCPHDQAIINAVMTPEEKELVPGAYNCCTSKKELYEKAMIIHYTGSFKPWIYNARWRKKKIIWFRYYLINKKVLKGEKVNLRSIDRYINFLKFIRPLLNAPIIISERIFNKRYIPADSNIE